MIKTNNLQVRLPGKKVTKCNKLMNALTIGVHGTFFLFSIVLLLSLPIVYCILPETKDLGLEMIQTYFTPNKTIFYVDLIDPKLKQEEKKPEII